MVVQVAVFALTSVTVKVTVTGVPISAQEKSVTSMLKVAIPQSSVDPLSTSAAVMVAIPISSKATVNGATHEAVGGTISWVITSIVVVAIRPQKSVTEKVTVVVVAPDITVPGAGLCVMAGEEQSEVNVIVPV